jgi:hypothetical protein
MWKLTVSRLRALMMSIKTKLLTKQLTQTNPGVKKIHHSVKSHSKYAEVFVG